MKRFELKFSIFAVVISGILFFTACDEPEITLSRSSMEINADDTEEKQVMVETNASSWTLHQDAATWLEVIKRDNKALFVKAISAPSPTTYNVPGALLTAFRKSVSFVTMILGVAKGTMGGASSS